MSLSCRELALNLCSMLVNVRNFASQLSQFEKLGPISSIPQWFKDNTRELVKLRYNSAHLSDLDYFNQLIRKMYSLSRSSDCKKQLSIVISQESKTMTAILIYARKIILFEEKFTREYDYEPELHQRRYSKLFAEVDEIAKELDLELPLL